MIVVVTGGRSWRPKAESDYQLRWSLAHYGARILRHGGCRGLDMWAGKVARSDGYETQMWPAVVGPGLMATANLLAYDTLEGWRVCLPPPDRKWPSAGPLRNRDMVKGADILFAYPGNKGTASCVREARKAGLKIVSME